MDNITKLAKHMKERDNPAPYSPMLGRIISLPELKIHISDRVILRAEDVDLTFDIYENEVHDGRRVYEHLGKRAVLLPVGGRFIVIGVLLE